MKFPERFCVGFPTFLPAVRQATAVRMVALRAISGAS
jgi:hypothetical protein